MYFCVLFGTTHLTPPNQAASSPSPRLCPIETSGPSSIRQTSSNAVAVIFLSPVVWSGLFSILILVHHPYAIDLYPYCCYRPLLRFVLHPSFLPRFISRSTLKRAQSRFALSAIPVHPASNPSSAVSAVLSDLLIDPFSLLRLLRLFSFETLHPVDSFPTLKRPSTASFIQRPRRSLNSGLTR